MGRVLQALEVLDRDLQAAPPHPLMGTASLHASIIEGGRELSTYPDRCVLKLERRTIEDDPNRCALAEVEDILHQLRMEDPEFAASAKFLFSRPPYLTPFSAGNELVGMIAAA